jgi:hypothetical protein
MKHLHPADVERSFVALLAGFATMAVLVTMATLFISRRMPRFVGEPGHPRRNYIIANLTYSAAFAAMGGYVTALVAKGDPLSTVLVLAIAILLLSALSALQMRGRQPIVYQFALMVVTPIAALAGGLLRMHEAGYRW